MAAYAAVISLRNTIEHILDSPRISLLPPSSEIIRLACREMKSFKKLLPTSDSSSIRKCRKKVNALDGRIQEAIWEFEDLLESHLSYQIVTQLESSGGEKDLLLFSVDLQSIRCDVDSFVATMKNMQEEYTYELKNLPHKEEDEFISAGIDLSGLTITEHLFRRYYYLPQHLKMIFFCMGCFPQDDEIFPFKLTYMLRAEGVIEHPKTHASTDIVSTFVSTCLMELDKWCNFFIGTIQTHRLTPSWQQLCEAAARKNKLFHVINSRADGLKGQRRLCLRSNVLFGFKKVYNSVKCDCASTARSLLCFGPYNRYSVSLDVGFKLLRVIDALRIRFYNFPIEILELVLLQYLALTCDGNVPPSISNLFNLQFLIICPHMIVKSRGAPWFMPVQIWDMQELKHIQINGSSLPSPKVGAPLQKLSKLLGVSADNCTKEVFEKIPNLKKLGIEIQLMPLDDGSNPLCVCDHISQLKNLEKLICNVANPEVRYGFVAPLNKVSMLPSGLRKMDLSGLGYSWKYMKVIGSLPNLVVLNLRCHAFRGPKWGTKRKSFMSLEKLLIEDTCLVQWIPRHGSFPKLHTLRLKRCFKLQELRWPYAAGSGRIEMVDCNPLSVTCANKLKTRTKHDTIEVTACSSFVDEEIQ